jgi:uroporphyrinogen-III synthase
MPKVWITRAQPGAQATAARVRTLGLEPIVEPLLEVRPLACGEIDLASAVALAFTSANAVAAFAARSSARDRPVFAVGAATAAAARQAGFVDIVCGDGDVADLARLIAAHPLSASGTILHLSAAEAAGDLVGALAAGGVEARRVVLYETIARPEGPAARAALASSDLALLHSPRAAGILRERLAGWPTPRLVVLCLSPAVAAPLRDAGFARLEAASAPTEAALVDLLARACGLAKAAT